MNSTQGTKNSREGKVRSSPSARAIQGDKNKNRGMMQRAMRRANCRPAYRMRCRSLSVFARAVRRLTAVGSPAAAGVRASMCAPEANSMMPTASAPSKRLTHSRMPKPTARTKAPLQVIKRAWLFRLCRFMRIPPVFFRVCAGKAGHDRKRDDSRPGIE